MKVLFRMIKQRKSQILLLILIIFFLNLGISFAFRSKMFVNWNGPQIAIAMQHYSMKDYFPAPPGEFLYVMFAKAINYFLNDPFSSLLYLNIIASGLICLALFLIAMRIFSFKVGLVSSLLYLASPLFLFYSTTIANFPTTGFFALITGFFLFEVLYRRDEKFFLWASLSYGLFIGARPQDIFFILPLWLWAFFKVRMRNKILATLVLISICAAWFIPLVIISGGAREFFSFLIQEISSGSTRLSYSIFSMPALLKANLKYQIIVYIITFGLGVMPFLYYLPQFFNLKDILSNRKTQIMLIWIIPSLIFWSVYNFGAPGYIIVSLLPLIILLAEFISRLTDEFTENISLKAGILRNKNVALILFMFMLFSVNAYGYFYDFNPRHKGSDSDAFRRYPDNKKRDIQVSEKINYIQENIPAENSVIVVSSSFFMPAMYYLPHYHIYLLNGIIHQGNTSVKYGHNFKRFNFNDFDTSDLISDNQIEHIVFFDDIFSEFINSKAKIEVVPIAQRYCLTIVNPQKGDRLIYSYKDIQIQ